METELSHFQQALSDIMASRASLLLRMRLQCAVYDRDGQPVDRFEGMGKSSEIDSTPDDTRIR